MRNATGAGGSGQPSVAADQSFTELLLAHLARRGAWQPVEHTPSPGPFVGGEELAAAGLEFRERRVASAAVGELEAAAPTMFSGYVGDKRGTAASLRHGFFRTGDLGRVGPGGQVVLAGRLKDVIVRGGNNVATRQVEHVLEGHPDVVEAAVVGVPDADHGEEVAAAVVLRRGAGKATLGELDARCRQFLAAYMRPRRWRVLDRLPRTATGKVRKEELREALIRGD